MKTALIFGHTSGLGYQVTKRFLDAGYAVIGIARRKSDVVSDNLVNITADLSRKDDVLRVVQEIKGQHSTFDVVIYCAGMLIAHDIDKLDYDQMERSYKVNTFAPMTIESGLLDLIKKNSADVLNVSSSSIVDLYPKYSEYSSSKIALQKFTNDLQKALKDTPSRVVHFCPSGFTSNIYNTMIGEKVDRDESVQMKSEDLADLIYYLLALPKKIEITDIYVNRK
jgi:short-subunit dehydrogenase